MGNPFVHVDLTTGDVALAKKFYKAIFDWSFQDFPEMGWSGVVVGEGVGGGMGGKPAPEAPTAWTPYVGVADVKETLAKVEKAGGTILQPYMEIPGMGALGVFLDPQGAALGVWQTFAPPAPPKKAPAKKAPAKAAAKKAPAKAAAKKAPAKAAAKKAPAKAAAKKAPAKKTAKRR